jgi:hypothetical protein
VIQVKRPIAKLYSWAQGGLREEGRVLPYPMIAPIFCVKILVLLKRFRNGLFGEVKVSKSLNPNSRFHSCLIFTTISLIGCHFETV